MSEGQDHSSDSTARKRPANKRAKRKATSKQVSSKSREERVSDKEQVSDKEHVSDQKSAENKSAEATPAKSPLVVEAKDSKAPQAKDRTNTGERQQAQQRPQQQNNQRSQQRSQSKSGDESRQNDERQKGQSSRGGKKHDPAVLADHAWKLYLAEISEEGLALVDDKRAHEMAKRCFTLASIFLDEESRNR